MPFFAGVPAAWTLSAFEETKVVQEDIEGQRVVKANAEAGLNYLEQQRDLANRRRLQLQHSQSSMLLWLCCSWRRRRFARSRCCSR